MESNLNNEQSPLLQKATLRDEHGYIILPRTVSSAITIDDPSAASHLKNPNAPHELNELLATYSTAVGIANTLATTIKNKADKDHNHEGKYLTRKEVNEMISNAQLPEYNIDLSESFADKVDKVDGKGLSTNDFTDALKNKLANLTADDVVETDNRLFMKPIERIKLARLDNGGKYRISFNDLIDKPEILSRQEIEQIATGQVDFSSYATKIELNNLRSEVNNKAPLTHTHN